MSVPESQRTKCSFKPIDLAMALCLHSLTLTSNENIFKPEYYYKITIDIENTAKKIYYSAWQANGVNMRGGQDTIARNWEERYKLEMEVAKC